MLGKVSTYDSRKGWGFIHGDDGRRYYVSQGNISLPSRCLYPGYTVEFSVREGNRALNVRYPQGAV